MPQAFQSAKGQAASNSGAIIKLSFCCATIASYLRHTGIPVTFLEVSVWKGQQPKHVTLRRVQRNWNIAPEDHNETDAIGIGDYYIRHVLNYRSNRRAVNLEDMDTYFTRLTAQTLGLRTRTAKMAMRSGPRSKFHKQFQKSLLHT